VRNLFCNTSTVSRMRFGYLHVRSKTARVGRAAARVSDELVDAHLHPGILYTDSTPTPYPYRLKAASHD